MSRIFQLFVVMATLLFSMQCHAQWTRVDKDTIRLDGDIGRDAYHAYLDVAKGGYSKVILKSAGGSPLPALMIAQDMLRHRPNVIVRGYCFSACANYLLLASHAPVVECGALLIWHGSPSSGFASNIQIMRLEGKNAQLIERYEDWSKRFEAMEEAYFSATGVSREILSDSVAIVSREHIAPAAKFEFDEVTGDYSETVSSGLWIPGTKVIRSYGIETGGFCPSYDSDIPASLKRLKISAPYTSRGR